MGIQVGDIIEVNNVAHSHKEFKVVEVWDDNEVPRFLVTDVEQTSGKCWPILQCDATLVRKEEYIRTIVTCKQSEAFEWPTARIYTPIMLGRD